MSEKSEGWNVPKSWNHKLLNNWEIDRLLTDLEAKTQKRYRENTRKDLLLGLLCGCNLHKISRDLHKRNAAVRVGLSNIYRDIESLTGEPNNSVKSSNLLHILQKYGYRRGVAASCYNPIIPHNLPPQTYTQFIGREEEMKALLKLLSPDSGAHMISVHGIGGVGKTALVLEAAYLCLKASSENFCDVPIPEFDAIIFTCAKQQELIGNSILERQQGQRNLRDIFREIANTLDPTIIQCPPNDQFDRVRQSLCKQRTLMIVDNMETIDDRDAVIEFLYCRLAASVKVVITTRERIGWLPIALRNLPLNDGLQLIEQQAKEKGVTLGEQESKQLYDRTGGIPLAIVYAVGQVCTGSLNSVLGKLAVATSHVPRFCFEQSVRRMRGEPSYFLLMSVAIFVDPTLQAAVAQVAGLVAAPDSVDDGLVHLQKLSLVNFNQKTKRYQMLSLTREYALAQLAAHPNFEKQARQRWLQWYLDFARKYAGEDWENWINYDKLEEEHGNLGAVLYWCQDQGDYESVRDLWLLLNHYANLYADWDERLNWLQWLIEQSQQRGEWSSFVKFIIRKSWLLIRECSPQSLQEAEEILLRAWDLRNYVDLCDRADLAESIARLQIRYKDYQQARNWLTTEESLVNQACLDQRRHARYFIPVLYHRAEIFFQENLYLEAKMLFAEVKQNAEKINWHRVINSAQNWLADIAIIQGDRLGSQQLLIQGLAVAQSSKNKRRLARYQRSGAYWQKHWGTPEQAEKFALEAINSFKLLGMTRDVQEMQSFLSSENP